MRRPATIVWGLVATALTVVGSLNASNVDSRFPAVVPHRMIDIRFLVDNPELLDKKFLELAVREDKFQRRLAKISPQQDQFGHGIAEVPLPDGALHVTVCAFVKCGDSAPSEMVCGESALPSIVEVDKIHEIHFSTNWACSQNAALNPASRGVDLAKSR